ncbi:ATP-binding protein [Altererythrobacter sp. KTW20L]|uniref:ATP-binding protein n=1 Tax=Altererythrobacter sp. KTW20L TaxID=2942210 RepID=UPI0020C06A61|nr:ATP-binding protein [Altererythrobacter sp. KTW20L]MCL6251171.1 ATP-binding protein [Altererythrobacter sp. KTW20L]
MLHYALHLLFVATAGVLAVLLVRLHRQTASRMAPALPPLPAKPDHGDPQAEADADERWSAFLIGMSHELRTPMNAVIGFTEMLLEADLPESQHQQVRLIADSGRAMLRLLNDVLDISRIKAGQVRLVEEETDLAEELRQAIALMQPIAAAKGLDLSLDLSDEVPARLALDRLRLRQVVLNLIGNALKFTDRGHVRVGLALAADQVAITVRDTGRGIAAERLPGLFTPFPPEHGTAERHYGGTGLGLPICQQLVRLMGGTIDVDSIAGQGSLFAIRLPLRDVGRASAAPVAAAAPPETAPSLRGRRVLVAEDHPINQQLILAMTGALGLDVKLATNGREAVDMALAAQEAGHPFELVLMDVQMPMMDGLAAARALRAAGLGPGKLAIIALTANCHPEDIAAVLDAGMQAHLAKPLMLADLERVLADQLRSDIPGSRTPEPCDVLRQPEGISATIHSLDFRYRQRKAELFDLIEAAHARRDALTDWETIATGLHRLAGTAANFGDAELGNVARRIERELRATMDSDARHAALASHFTALREAA